MKKLFVLAAFILLGATAVNAQQNVVKVNPLALLGGSDLVSYERAFGEKTSGIISGAVGGFKIGDVKYKSAGAGLQFRYYFDEVLSGWYGGAIADYQSGTVESESTTFTFDGDVSTESDDFDFSSFGGGLKIGHQWVWDSGFTLDLNLGASYKSFDYDLNDPQEEERYKASGVLPTFGFGLGYAF
ncbi:DUF3575 domain-containing protein [Mesoflavibacter profundi]|uniref:DUF3575 domain-containing protein n=1 Tax=Mesoflavibacter profundi TaxID=2708110 RepID=A0ABT4RXA8_9FLAO|nr:DUF3575 domain-containing protein [Mesoflavibacter profundi]MDA0176454.1 DUF3575 domain-containing protein [Mesoflavibacter profundi]